jgi:hypothetical protein
MKLNINIREVQFEGENTEYSFHSRIKIKKEFERELNALLSEEITQTRSNLIDGILSSTVYDPHNSNIKFVKEIDGNELPIITVGENAYLTGKNLANSICSMLNLLDAK